MSLVTHIFNIKTINVFGTSRNNKMSNAQTWLFRILRYYLDGVMTIYLSHLSLFIRSESGNDGFVKPIKIDQLFLLCQMEKSIVFLQHSAGMKNILDPILNVWF